MFFLTLGDAYSGVYNSQVIDVVHHLIDNHERQCQLVSFQSPRIFFTERSHINKYCRNAIVLPSFPGLTNWKNNAPLLSIIVRFLKPKQIIARGIFAANLALEMKNKGLIERVIYDGRGATSAEWEEYGYGQNEFVTQNIVKLEYDAVQKSDMRIAVSKKLVCYWQNKFDYNDDKHEIIPCLLSDNFLDAAQNARRHRKELKQMLGYSEKSIILVFSGGIGKWQSSKLLSEILLKFLDSNSNIYVLLLTKSNRHLTLIMEHYPTRVNLTWLEPNSIPDYLAVADYGLLIREPSLTNTVAAPTKFAEYLALGLKVLISADIGDYSDFVTTHCCGYILDEKCLPNLKQQQETDQKQMVELAHEMFTKNTFKNNYDNVLTSK